MTFEVILQVFVSACPALAAIFGIIAAVIKLIKAGKDTNKELKEAFDELRESSKQETKDLRDQYTICLQQNYELNKKLNTLLTKMDRVQREE